MVTPMPYDSQSPPAKPRRNALGVAILIGLIMLIFVGCLGCIGVVTTSGSPDNVGAPVPRATPTAGEPDGTPKNAVKATTKPRATTSRKPTPASYATISARQWRKIAKDPDAYSGKRYVVHGVVTQFDAATGPTTFRADLDGVRHADRYEYETNTIMSAAGNLLDDLVEGDHFTASVQVVGGYTYETQLGGQATAPELVAFKIKRR